jgi:hypothetical protein
MSLNSSLGLERDGLAAAAASRAEQAPHLPPTKEVRVHCVLQLLLLQPLLRQRTRLRLLLLHYWHLSRTAPAAAAVEFHLQSPLSLVSCVKIPLTLCLRTHLLLHQHNQDTIRTR